MPKDERESPSSERSLRVEGPIRRPMEISSDALELLRSAAIPSEFLKVAREFAPGKEVLFPIAPEAYSKSAEIEAPSIERPMPETPVEPGLEMPAKRWPEELPGPQLEVPVEPVCKEVPWTTPEVPLEPSEEFPREEVAETFYLTALTFDLSAVAHPTPGLLDWEGVPLKRVVTDTYPMYFDEDENGVFEEDPGGEGEEIGEEPPCVDCKLILVWGAADKAIAAALNAAERYFDAKPKEKCVIAIRKAGTAKTPERYFGNETKQGKDKWVAGGTDKIRGWLSTDPNRRKIDCFTHVLAIYHGADDMNSKTSVAVLKWLARHCKVPIHNLYLWSCWGSEKIDLADKDMKDALRKVDDPTGLKEEAKDLEKKLGNLKKETKPNNKDLEETEKKLAAVEEQLTKLKKRIDDCECELCLYTATSLNKATAQDRLPGEIEKREQEFSEAAKKAQEWKDKMGGSLKQKSLDAAEDEAEGALKEANEARTNLEKREIDQYPMPLGIRKPETDAPLVLLAPETKMRVYCPLNLDLDNPEFKMPEINRIFEDVPIEQDNDLIVKGLLRMTKGTE